MNTKIVVVIPVAAITGPAWLLSSRRLRLFMKMQTISAVLAVSVLLAGCGNKNVSSGTSQSPAKDQTNTVLAAVAAGSTNSSIFQIRLVLDAPSADSEPMSIITNGVNRAEVVNLQNKVLLDQSALKSAKAVRDNLGQFQIVINLTESGQKQFAEVTRENIGKRLAIVIDGQLYSAPMINAEISGGVAVISGGFSEQEARELAAKIMESLKNDEANHRAVPSPPLPPASSFTTHE